MSRLFPFLSIKIYCTGFRASPMKYQIINSANQICHNSLKVVETIFTSGSKTMVRIGAG